MSSLSKKLKLQKAKLLYTDLEKASQRLKEICEVPFTTANRDATIKRFEFTFEVAWKLIKTLVELSSRKTASPRSSIRIAADIDLLDEPEKWLNFLELRNMTVHIYKEEMIKEVYLKVKKFPQFVQKLLVAAKSHLK